MATIAMPTRKQPDHTRRANPKYRSPLCTRVCAASTAAMAARAWSGVGCSPLTSHPPDENERAGQKRDQRDRDCDPEVVTGLTGGPESSADAHRGGRPVPEIEGDDRREEPLDAAATVGADPQTDNDAASYRDGKHHQHGHAGERRPMMR